MRIACSPPPPPPPTDAGSVGRRAPIDGLAETTALLIFYVTRRRCGVYNERRPLEKRRSGVHAVIKAQESAERRCRGKDRVAQNGERSAGGRVCRSRPARKGRLKMDGRAPAAPRQNADGTRILSGAGR